MARPDRLDVRLIAWEGPLEKGQVVAYTSQLSRNINECLVETKWKYSRFKLYPIDGTGRKKLEVYVRHHGFLEDHAKTNALHDLCSNLLRSDLAARLRLENPSVPFTFCPSQEGVVTVVDNQFARCFSVAVVTQYCVDGTQSEEMQRIKSEVQNRNLTIYLHTPMVGIYNLASIAELYETHILQMLRQIEEVNGIAGVEGTFAKLRQTVEKHMAGLGGGTTGKKSSQLIGIARSGASAASHGIGKKGEQTPEQMLRLSIAIAVSFARAFVSHAPEIKNQLRPMLQVLNEVTIKSRLTLALQAYIDTSRAPIAALESLAGCEKASPDQIATTINSFGSLMQSTLPLFDATLAISDKEFASILNLSIAGGVGLAGLGSGATWLWCAGATTGPVGLMIAGGATVAAFGAKALYDGVKWSKKQSLEPSNVLLSIQKSVEECCRFLLGLAFMLSEEEEAEGMEKQDPAYLEKIQTLRDQLQNENFAKPGYMRGYYRLVSDKLKQDMVSLAEGLKARGVEVVIADG